MMPVWLRKLRDNKIGIPVKFFEGMECDKDYNYTTDQENEALNKWHDELTKMIDGFEAVEKLGSYYSHDEERQRLEKIFEIGFESLKNNWGSL